MEIIRVPAVVALVLSPPRVSVVFFVHLLVLNFHGFEAE